MKGARGIAQKLADTDRPETKLKAAHLACVRRQRGLFFLSTDKVEATCPALEDRNSRFQLSPKLINNSSPRIQSTRQTYKWRSSFLYIFKTELNLTLRAFFKVFFNSSCIFVLNFLFVCLLSDRKKKQNWHIRNTHNDTTHIFLVDVLVPGEFKRNFEEKNEMNFDIEKWHSEIFFFFKKRSTRGS